MITCSFCNELDLKIYFVLMPDSLIKTFTSSLCCHTIPESEDYSHPQRFCATSESSHQRETWCKNLRFMSNTQFQVLSLSSRQLPNGVNAHNHKNYQKKKRRKIRCWNHNQTASHSNKHLRPNSFWFWWSLVCMLALNPSSLVFFLPLMLFFSPSFAPSDQTGRVAVGLPRFRGLTGLSWCWPALVCHFRYYSLIWAHPQSPHTGPSRPRRWPARCLPSRWALASFCRCSGWRG